MKGHGFNILGELAYRTDMLQSIPAQVSATGDKLTQTLFHMGVKKLVFSDTADADYGFYTRGNGTGAGAGAGAAHDAPGSSVLVNFF